MASSRIAVYRGADGDGQGESGRRTMDATAQAAATGRSRRDLMRAGVAAVVAALGPTPLALAADDDADGEVIPFLDPQAYDPKRPMLNWDELRITDWLTPTKQVYHVSHYGEQKFNVTGWKLDVSGLVGKQLT